jgi:hypothetical protein
LHTVAEQYWLQQSPSAAQVAATALQVPLPLLELVELPPELEVEPDWAGPHVPASTSQLPVQQSC